MALSKARGAGADGRVGAIERRLREAFGSPRRRPPGPAAEELVSTVLSQHTTGPNSDRALASLRERFPAWDDVADADSAEIAACIRSAGLANQKAPRIKAMLAAVRDERGTIELDFLRDLAVDEAMAWLRRLPGVGQTTAACLLLFGLDRPAMPVDTGIARVAARLGLVPSGAPGDLTQRVLQEGVRPERVYALHVNLIHHAREICRPRDPLCGACPINDLCDAFRAVRGGARGSLD
ncbi:MAG TPA: endonuclease III [Chloroflexota bacterium]|nr:endonuclease III [Chloroflexota bacterium]